MVRLLFSKNIFIFSSLSSSSSSVRALLFQTCHFSRSSNNSALLRRHDQESRSIPVSVWWDFENCNTPADANVFRITHFITKAVRAKGIKGPLQIKAFGDILQLSRTSQEALTSTGVKLIHIPKGGKNSADRSLLIDLMYWVSQNPPPAHLFLISSDKDFAEILHRLRMNNYNILIAGIKTSNILCSVATIVWHWNSLLRGENLEGKHFNHPPDGWSGSWYGHHNATLEDPFSDGKQSACSQNEKIPKPLSGLNLRPIPKAVARKIHQILNSYPNGISLKNLHMELEGAGICLDKDYYGHKRFSHFLSAVAHAEFHFVPSKGLFAYIPKNSPEPIESQELNHVATSKLSGEEEKIVRTEDVTLSAASSHELIGDNIPEKIQQVVDVANASVTESQMPPKENEIPCTSDVSQVVPEKYKTSDDYFAELSYTVVEKSGILDNISEKLNDEDNYVKPTRKEPDAVCHTGGSTETHSNNFSKHLTFLGWIKSWWPFRKNVGNTYNLSAHGNEMVSDTEEPESSYLKQTVSHSKEPELSNYKQRVSHSEEQRLIGSQFEEPESSEVRQMVNCFGEPKLFSSSSFWSDMKSFVFTSRGTIIVSCSRNRKDMIRNFQKYGPQVLISLSENDLLLLVDLLISEKKWLEERPSLTFPFRIIPAAGKSSMVISHGAKGLRSLFASRTTQSNLQESSECEVDKKHNSISQTVVSSPVTQKEHTDKSRIDMIEDVQNLVSEILREQLDGYNLGLVPKLFVRKYGYVLDVKKLGYQKLSSLLDSLPGVKTCYGSLFPANHGIFAYGPETSSLKIPETKLSEAVHYYSDNELHDSFPDDDCKARPWVELGPVFVSNSNQSDLESKPRQEAIMLKTSVHPDYESCLSEEDSSESGGYSSCLTQLEEEGQPKLNGEDSYVLQTTDSIYRSQEGEYSLNSNKANPESNGLTDGLNPSKYSTPATSSKIHSGIHKDKRKPQKIDSFVDDPVSNKNNKLFEGISQRLWKSDDLKMPH